MSKNRNISDAKRQAVWQKSGGNCHWCGKPMVRSEKTGSAKKSNDFTVDHVVPFAAGGSNSLDNLVGAHYSCNQERGKALVGLSNPHWFKAVDARKWGLDDPVTTRYCGSLRDSHSRVIRSVQLVQYKPFSHKPVGWLTRVARWAGAI
jgi:5-methylcytosine-specific restriction endonuclease McrA